MGIHRIRRAVQADRYEFSVHALDEMDEDLLSAEDVRQVLLHGDLVAELTDDPRGVRYVVHGLSLTQGEAMEVVTRLLPSGLLRIITVYALNEGE